MNEEICCCDELDGRLNIEMDHTRKCIGVLFMVGCLGGECITGVCRCIGGDRDDGASERVDDIIVLKVFPILTIFSIYVLISRSLV